MSFRTRTRCNYNGCPVPQGGTGRYKFNVKDARLRSRRPLQIHKQQLSTVNASQKISLKNIETFEPQRKSLMPDSLLRDLTAEQAADLLAYLESLK